MKKLFILTGVIIFAQLFAVAQVQKVENSRFSDEKPSTRQYGFVTIINESKEYEFTISSLSFQETGRLVKSRNWAILRNKEGYTFTRESSHLKIPVSLVNFTQINNVYEEVYLENGVEVKTGERFSEPAKGKTYDGIHLAFKVTFKDGRTQIVSGEINRNQSIGSGREVGHSYSFTITDESLGLVKNSISFKNSTNLSIMLKSTSGKAIIFSPGEERVERVNHEDIPQNGMYTFDLWIKSNGFAWAQIESMERVRVAIVDGEVDIVTSDIFGREITVPSSKIAKNNGRAASGPINIVKKRDQATVYVENGTERMVTMYIARVMQSSTSDLAQSSTSNLAELQPYTLDLSGRPLILSAVPGQYPVLYYVGEFSGKFKLGTIGITNNKRQKVVVGTRRIESYY